MKRKNFKLIFGFMVLVLFIGLSGNNIMGNKMSYSLTEDESFKYFKSISLVSDKHLTPGEKAYVDLDADLDHVKNISLELYSYKNKKRLFADLENIKNKPYFVIEKFDKNAVLGNTYSLDVVHVTFSDNSVVNYSFTNSNGLYVMLDSKQDNFVTLDNNYLDSTWRDFVDVRIPLNTFAVVDGNTYVDLNADTRDIASVALEFENSNKESFITYLENIDTRAFFILKEDDVVLGEAYNLVGVEVFYKDGVHVSYSTIMGSDLPYLSIGDERSFIAVRNVLDGDVSRNINEEDKEVTSSITNVETINNDFDIAFGGVIVLVIGLLIALGIFVFLKDEDR